MEGYKFYIIVLFTTLIWNPRRDLICLMYNGQVFIIEYRKPPIPNSI